MTFPEIAKHRLLTQQIVEAKVKSAIEMIAWFGAVQAQEYAQTKWGLGLRLPHLNDNDIEKDFTEGKILRTHLIRPTWHLVTANDIRWLLMLTAPRVNVANAYMYRQLDLDSTIFNRCNKILIKTLQGGKQLTRDALNEEFKRNKIIAAGHRLSYIMMRAELDGIICSGAREGNQFTYTLLEERVPESKARNYDEALAELTMRYFTSRGPATIKDFSTWSGLTLTDCKKGIAIVKTQLNEEQVYNEKLYYSSHTLFNKKQYKGIYDEYIMGYKNRDAILEYRNRIEPKPLFRFDNTMISEGQITGTWKRTVKKNSTDIAYDFFKPPNEAQLKAFENAIHRLEAFTGLKVTIKNE